MRRWESAKNSLDVLALPSVAAMGLLAWGGNWIGDEHLVDVHIAHLRRKLGDDPDTARYISTVRGIGYLMGKG